MTASRAAVITGLDVSVGPASGPGKYFLAKAFDGPRLIAESRACCRPSAALSDLVEKLYKIRSQEVYARAKYRCEKCGALGKPMQVHHIKFRSHGRDDRASNLTALCGDCHQAAHGR